MDSIVIVLGNPPKKDGTIASNLQARLDIAINEYRKGNVNKILLSGGSVYNSYVEAEIMKQYCINNEIDINDIIIENKARSTYDNALYSAMILNDYNVDRIIIATSRFHKRRSNKIFKHYFREYEIIVPRFDIINFIKNIHIYCWELYLNIKLLMKGDKRLDRKIENDID
jgi:uncharacterized SAM-binding protein YcdF (DUF218 family)